MRKALLTLYATEYLHPGAGSTTGAIDLPVQREVHSDLPVIAASGLKGALRQKAGESEDWTKNIGPIFGPRTGNADKYSGALVVGEAKLLALPIRSLKNVFQWASSPLVLERLRRDLARIGADLPEAPPHEKDRRSCPPEAARAG